MISHQDMSLFEPSTQHVSTIIVIMCFGKFCLLKYLFFIKYHKWLLNMLLGALMWRMNTTFQLVVCHFRNKKQLTCFLNSSISLCSNNREKKIVQLRTCHRHQWIYDIFELKCFYPLQVDCVCLCLSIT